MKKVSQEKNVGLDEPTGSGDADQIFLIGWTASKDGVAKFRNPFVKDTEAWDWWRLGWEAHYYNEECRLPK